MACADKRQHHLTQNLLARSLLDRCCERQPGFLDYARQAELPFLPLPRFCKAELEERQRLYRLPADRMWYPWQLAREATSA